MQYSTDLDSLRVAGLDVRTAVPASTQFIYLANFVPLIVALAKINTHKLFLLFEDVTALVAGECWLGNTGTEAPPQIARCCLGPAFSRVFES